MGRDEMEPVENETGVSIEEPKQETAKAEEAPIADENTVKAEASEITRKAPLRHIKIQVKNMICESCEKIIEKSLLKVSGVRHAKVKYIESTAKIAYEPEKVSIDKIRAAIKEAGYGSELAPARAKSIKNTASFTAKRGTIFFALIGLIALVALIISYFALSTTLGQMNIAIPQLDANTSAVIIFVVGLLTGFHCIGMCGSFVLSYTAKARQVSPEALNIGQHGKYAAGKVISYSLIGGTFGLIGSVFVFTPIARAVIAFFAGAFLILFSLKMLNVHPALHRLSLPQGLLRKIGIGASTKNSDPLIIGLANGLFIACGPLQAMYILAMTAGSFLGGAIMLFAFAIGTLIPMLGFGVFASLISHTIQNKIARLSGAIVLVMGLLMINNGLALSGNQLSISAVTGIAGGSLGGSSQTGTILDGPQGVNNGPGYQIINMDVTNAGYSPSSFVLKTGLPVKWVINGKQINSCNGSMIVPAYNLRFSVKQGEQTIEFTPNKAGVINWSCWMGMIQGTFIVRDDVGIDSSGKVITTPQTQQAINQQIASTPKPSGGCGCGGGSGG